MNAPDGIEDSGAKLFCGIYLLVMVKNPAYIWYIRHLYYIGYVQRCESVECTQRQCERAREDV